MDFIMGRLWKPIRDSSLKIDSNCDEAITLACFRYLVSKNLEENLAICTLVKDKVAILQRLTDCQMICHLKIRNGSLSSKTCFQFCSYQL